MLPLSDIRLGLYAFWLVCSVILFSLAIARVSYTSHTRSERSLNNGQPFYDPSVVELLVSALLTLFFAPFMIYATRTRRANITITIELGALFVLWLLWTGGAAAAVTVWPDLSFCVSFAACRLLQALMYVPLLSTPTRGSHLYFIHLCPYPRIITADPAIRNPPTATQPPSCLIDCAATSSISSFLTNKNTPPHIDPHRSPIHLNCYPPIGPLLFLSLSRS